MHKLNFKNSLVSGKSLISSTVKVLSANKSKCTYLEFKSFSDFIESVILHDNIYILGQFNDKENESIEFVELLNKKNNKDFIFSIDIKECNSYIDQQNLDSYIKEILEVTFEEKINLIRTQLVQKSYNYRYTDDEKNNFISEIVDLIKSEAKFDKYQELIVRTFKCDRESEFSKHLLRGVIIAAFAACINGTSKFTGTRKPLGALIINRNKAAKFATIPQQIYSYANSIYLKKISELNNRKYNQSLILNTFLLRVDNKENSLELIMDLRKEFESFRTINYNISQGDENILNKYLSDLKNFYSLRIHFNSKKDFLNLLKKYGSNLLLDESGVEVTCELDSDSDDESDDGNVNSSINLLKVAKNLIKLFKEYFDIKKIIKLNKPIVDSLDLVLNLKSAINN